MNIKTNLLEEYVNFVDNTKKQNNYFKIFLFVIAIIMFLFSFFVLFKYSSIYKNTSIRIHDIIQY